MREDRELAAMREYYAFGGEQERLDEPRGQLEFERTKEIVLRHLPPPPAIVAVEGPAFLLDDLGERLAEAEARRVVLETARALERVPELLGTGPHLLITASAGP